MLWLCSGFGDGVGIVHAIEACVQRHRVLVQLDALARAIIGALVHESGSGEHGVN